MTKKTGSTMVFGNGIDGESGEYITPPTDLRAMSEFIRKLPTKRIFRRQIDAFALRGLRPSFDLVPEYKEPEFSNPKIFGWGIIFHTDESRSVREALAPLIRHRRKLYGKEKAIELAYDGTATINDWLAERNAKQAFPDPDKMPFYLLIIGSPEKIPYSFQYDLDIDYFVGRLSFNDADGYAAYVKSVIKYEKAEKGEIKTRRSVAFFGPEHDEATTLSANMLVSPLAKGYLERGKKMPSIAKASNYGQKVYLGAKALKENLLRLLHDPKAGRPSLLFTASHGIRWRAGHPRQIPAQGALLCQDWAGNAPKPEDYLAASDIEENACLSGLIGFHFACYAAGTPKNDEFPKTIGGPLQALARAPFIASLPQRMLSHPKGAALAVLGHVERAWSCSIPDTGDGHHISHFREVIARILRKQPVGYAKKRFPEIYRSTSAGLTQLLTRLQNKLPVSDEELVSKWTERNDARNYILLGDPAVCLRGDDLLDPLE